MGSGPESVRDALLHERLLAGAPVVVFVVDRQGSITWVGGAVEKLTGYTSAELLGTDMLSHIVVEWNPFALDSVLYAMGHSGLRRPMLFRVLRKDGSTFVGEITANSQMDDPVIGGLAAYLRPWDERYLLDLVIESLASNAPLDHTLGLLVDVIGAETLQSDGVVFLDPVAGRFARSVAAEGLPGALSVDTDGGEQPWHTALGRGEPVCIEVSGLTGPTRDIAAGSGYCQCWCWPVMTEETGGGCVVLWRTEEEEPDYTCKMMLENLVRITGLVIEREHASALLRHAATHDPLTTLANRSGFVDHLDSALSSAADGELIGCLYIDLDNFKPVNDRHGHAAGDEVLRVVGHRFQSIVRSDDLVARLGGDEFAVVCNGFEGEESLHLLAGRLTEAAAQPVILDDGVVVVVGASVGIAVTSGVGRTSAELVEAADRALYETKSSGRGGWTSASALMRRTRDR